MRLTPRLQFAAGIALLLVYGMAMAATNYAFPFQDDEIVIIVNANNSIHHTLDLFASGVGQHEHPPLYDLLLHLWLRLTRSRIKTLRLPSIAFFLAGIWFMAASAQKAGGWPSYWSCLAIGVLWPFGFQYGRLAGWYSFCFFLVALVAYNYLQLVNDGSSARWWKLGLSCGALIYTNYFAWPILGCLAVDYSILKRSHRSLRWKPFLILGGSLLLAFLPLAPAFWAELRSGLVSPLSPDAGNGGGFLSAAQAAIRGFVTSVFVLSAGDSVGLWFWFLSIPAVIAILVCIWLVLQRSRDQMTRLFCYGFLLLAPMSVLGFDGDTPRIFFLAPWLLLPVAVALRTCRTHWDGGALVAALVVIAAIGWIGIRNSNFLGKWDIVVPWEQVTRDLTKDLTKGDAVATSDLRFFLYLNGELRLAERGSYMPYLGLETYLSNGVHVYNVGSERELASYAGPRRVIAVGRWPYLPEPGDWLNTSCTLQNVRLSIEDVRYDLKKRFYPATKQQPHPFQIVEYDCDSREAATSNR